MSRYLRKGRCKECGEPHWFRDWVGEFCASSRDGLNVSDFDLALHRFKRVTDSLGCRDVEHLMIAEIKTADERLGANQRDTLSVVSGLISTIVPVNGEPINVKSRPGYIIRRDKKVVWHGIHLLRVPARKNNIGPFFWDNHPVDSHTLSKVLNFDNDWKPPFPPLDIDRRHKSEKKAEDGLFSSLLRAGS